MDRSKIILANAFDIKNYKYTKAVTLESGGKSIYSNYAHPDGSSSSLIMQTPSMIAPFGLSKWTNDKTGKVEKYSIDLSFKCTDAPDSARAQSLQAFGNALKDLDSFNIDQMFTNCQAWTKTKYTSREVVQALYTPLFRLAKDKNTGEFTDQYPPTFKLNLPMRDGVLACEIYDPNGNPIDIETIDIKGARVAAIVRCTGLWVAAGKFGCTFKALQLMVWPNASFPKGVAAFIRDGCEDEVPAPAAAPALVQAVAAVAPAAGGGVAAAESVADPVPQQVSDEDEDDEDDDEDEDDIDAAPAPAKKVIRKPAATKV